jgi:hypothetical protein
VPAGRDHRTGERQANAHVQLPQGPPHTAGHRELEHRHRAAGPDDASELAQRRRGIVDVAKEIREGERIEFRVLERERLGVPFAQLDSSAEPGARDTLAAGGEHLRALVDADDGARGRRARELDRDGGGSGGDVGDARRFGGNARDEEPPPARVLPE